MPVDPQGTLRAELLSQLVNAQAELAATIVALRATGADVGVLSDSETHLGTLAALQQSVSTASPTAIAAMRSQIAATVAASSGLAQQARIAAGSTEPAISTALASASTATRNEVQSLEHDLYDRQMFDANLNFDSAKDEENYRRREAESRRYIDDQLAKKTPEGNLNAAGGAMGQMLDAHAHGAGDSPDFLPRWNQLVATTEQQRALMRSEGRSTEEFDHNINAAIRQSLKKQGLTDAEIDARLAASTDPLEAVRPYITSDKDMRAFGRSVEWVGKESGDVQPQTLKLATASNAGDETIADRASMPPGLDDVMAKFQSSGVITADQGPDDSFAHGVAAVRSPLSKGPSPG